MVSSAPKLIRKGLVSIAAVPLVCALGVVSTPLVVYALAPGDCHDSNANAQCLVTVYVNPFIALLSAMVGIVVVTGILWGAVEFIQSGGDPAKAAAGKKKITNAVIGLVAFLLLYAFLQFILPGGL